MNYKVINDEKILKEFIDWLPDLTEEEVYYFCLFARSKYCKDENGVNLIPHIKSDKAQLKRFTCTKDRIFQKIQQLECPLGSYYQNTHEIPQQSLALYMTVNPRNLWTATKNSLRHFAEVVCTNGRTMNPQADAMSEIQRAKSRSCYIIADLDSKDASGLNRIKLYLDKGSYRIIETRGGYHILIDPDKQIINKNFWYKGIKETTNIDQMGDLMIPVPGCTQGNFTPHFIT